MPACPICTTQHDGQCHKCPHNADVMAGKYDGRAFEKTPCFGCQLSDRVHFTVDPDETTEPLTHEQDSRTESANVLREIWHICEHRPTDAYLLLARIVGRKTWRSIADAVSAEARPCNAMQCHRRIKVIAKANGELARLALNWYGTGKGTT